MPSLTKIQTGFMEAQGALPLSSGTAAAPGLKFDDHAGTGMFSPSTGAIGFSTSNHQQALTLDTAGRLGLGASNNTAYDSNAQNLLLASDGNTGMTIRSAGSTPFAMIHFADGTSGQAQQRAGRIMYQHDGDNLSFHTANTERLRINGDGKVGVGVTPNSNWHTADASTVLQVENSHLFDYSGTQLDVGHNYYYDGTNYKFSTTGHASRLTFNKSNGAMRLWSLGTGNANSNCTLSERFHVTASGQILAGGADTTLAHANADDVIIGNTSSGTRTGITLVSADNLDGGIYFSDGTSTNNANIQGQIVYNHNDTTLKFYVAASSAITIKEHGHTDFTGYADFIRPANDAYSYAGFGPGGTSAKAAFIRRGSEIDLEMWSNYTGSPTISINSDGSIFGSSINVQSSSTSSWFQTGTSIASYNYVWAAKNSSSNIWHSGLQTDGDLYLGGNLAGSNNIGLSGSTGQAFFASQAFNISTSGNLQIVNATTSAKLNVQGDIGGNYTGWKEKGVAAGSMSATSIASKTPTINDFTYPNNSNGMLIWSTSKIGFAAGAESPQYGSGVQMLYDGNALILGGIRAFDRTTSSSTATNWNVRLRSNGIGEFKSQLYANPLTLTSSNSWIKSGYGAISNGTVQSLNNLLIGQNMRGYINGIDGGSTNNNFYSLSTYGAGGMGHAGTEYCYDGITKFYNDRNASTTNTTFNPVTSMQINGYGQITTPLQPAFLVSRNQATWSVSGNTKFDWDLVVHNRGSHFSTSNDRFTAPVAGVYQFNFSIIYYQQTVNNEWISHRKNGSRITGGDIHFSVDYSPHTRWHNVSYSLSVYMNANDYMEVWNGGNATINYHGTNWGQWSGYLVG